MFQQSTDSVRARLAAGADRHHGGRSARGVAAFFGLDEMTALLLEG